jgi:hypothetical protein
VTVGAIVPGNGKPDLEDDYRRIVCIHNGQFGLDIVRPEPFAFAGSQ